MERIEFPLSQLTHDQKLYLMETLWDDLSKDENIFESPDWHEKILKEREDDLSSGKMTVSDWEVAKERIKRTVSCK